MKRALLIGIDAYDNFAQLTGCVNDVMALAPLLARHEDGEPNFECSALISRGRRVDRANLLPAINALLAPGAEVALIYFAGHGAATASDTTLCVQDGRSGDPGVPLSEILGRVQGSAVKEVILILDCCFAGGAAEVPQLGNGASVLRSGVSILAASRIDQAAEETANRRGLFSVQVGAGLEGEAADVLGRVTVAGLYAYLSESFGAWDQRPVFKANVDRSHELRLCSPAVPLSELRDLVKIFPSPDFKLPLDPSYEPTSHPKHPRHEAVFKILQRWRAARLLEPIGAAHLYFAAMQKRACRLTQLGKHYWQLAHQGRL